jgi:hypothetical protein
MIAYFPPSLRPFGRALRLQRVISEPNIRLNEGRSNQSDYADIPLPSANSIQYSSS